MEIFFFTVCSLLFCGSGLLIVFGFLNFLWKGKPVLEKWFRPSEFIVILVPGILLSQDIGMKNNCCGDTAVFSPEHRVSVFVVVILVAMAYFYCSYRKRITSPIAEIVLNCLLLVGIALNILIGIQLNQWAAGFLITPLISLILTVLIGNHRLALNHVEEWTGGGRITRFCRALLHLRPLAKFPILLVLCLPLLILLTGILMLFGQRPDALVRAFTDTYKQGFSQLDDQCNGVVCGGHFLCTIAAKGHRSLVRPIRPGIRAGMPIKCNRQLLISNAFEELLEQKVPALHRPIRNFYNIIGSGIHRHYGLFDHKWVSDLIYILMKPLEWIFLLVLYTFDGKPENRIAQQYMSPSDRQLVREARGC